MWRVTTAWQSSFHSPGKQPPPWCPRVHSSGHFCQHCLPVGPWSFSLLILGLCGSPWCYWGDKLFAGRSSVAPPASSPRPRCQSGPFAPKAMTEDLLPASFPAQLLGAPGIPWCVATPEVLCQRLQARPVLASWPSTQGRLQAAVHVRFAPRHR